MPANEFRDRTVLTPGNVALAGYLKSKRMASGLSLRALANLLNVSYVQISKVERLQRRLDVIELIRYCGALGIDPLEAVRLVMTNYQDSASAH